MIGWHQRALRGGRQNPSAAPGGQRISVSKERGRWDTLADLVSRRLACRDRRAWSQNAAPTQFPRGIVEWSKIRLFFILRHVSDHLPLSLPVLIANIVNPNI